MKKIPVTFWTFSFCSSVTFCCPWPFWDFSFCSSVTFCFPWPFWNFSFCSSVTFCFPWPFWNFSFCSSVTFCFPWSFCSPLFLFSPYFSFGLDFGRFFGAGTQDCQAVPGLHHYLKETRNQCYLIAHADSMHACFLCIIYMREYDIFLCCINNFIQIRCLTTLSPKVLQIYIY